MSFFFVKRIILLTIILILCALPQTYATPSCLLHFLSQESILPADLRLELVPKGVVRYPHVPWVGQNSYYKEVKLMLNKKDNVEAIAKVLAQGGDSTQILAQLNRRLEAAGDHQTVAIPIEEFLPRFVKENLGKPSFCKGPNCFSTVIKFHDSKFDLPKRKEMTLARFQELLDANYMELYADTQILFGDVVALEGNMLGYSKRILHVAIYLDGEILFHKANGNSKTPYVFERFSEMMRHYWEYGKNYRIRVFRHIKD